MARVCRVVHEVQSRAASSLEGPTTVQGSQNQNDAPSPIAVCKTPSQDSDRLDVHMLFARCFQKRELTLLERAGPLVWHERETQPALLNPTVRQSFALYQPEDLKATRKAVTE